MIQELHQNIVLHLMKLQSTFLEIGFDPYALVAADTDFFHGKSIPDNLTDNNAYLISGGKDRIVSKDWSFLAIHGNNTGHIYQCFYD
jgi:hypothetical protein